MLTIIIEESNSSPEVATQEDLSCQTYLSFSVLLSLCAMLNEYFHSTNAFLLTTDESFYLNINFTMLLSNAVHFCRLLGSYL